MCSSSSEEEATGSEGWEGAGKRWGRKMIGARPRRACGRCGFALKEVGAQECFKQWDVI